LVSLLTWCHSLFLEISLWIKIYGRMFFICSLFL
jgi:hypothetical protein